MRRKLVLLILVIGIGFSAPDANLILFRHRQLVEQTVERHTCQLTEDELIKERVAMYLQLNRILSVCARHETGRYVYPDTS